MFVALKHADCVDQRADLPIDSLAPGGMGDLWVRKLPPPWPAASEMRLPIELKYSESMREPMPELKPRQAVIKSDKGKRPGHTRNAE
jgi:hypothetical protein